METNKNKKGVVFVSFQIIYYQPEVMAKVFSEFLPVTSSIEFNETIKYQGYCESFDELKEGDPIPEYVATLTTTEHNGDAMSLKLSWNKKQ